MDTFDRIFQLHGILAGRRTPVALDELMQRLHCSRAGVQRLIATLRDEFGAPIEPVLDHGGYRYRSQPDGRVYELPGLWFTAGELEALLMFQHILDRLGGGLLGKRFAPFARRIEELMEHKRLSLGELRARVRVLGMSERLPGPHFPTVAGATLKRRKLRLAYYSRSRDRQTERTVSPQRIIRYGDHWYLDAWDELRRGLRSLSIERIGRATELEAPAETIADARLDEHLARAYGSFTGPASKVAVLRFSRERSRRVADERWHDDQVGQFLTDGRYELRIPYRDHRELLANILRHGAEVEVVAPEALRRQLVDILGRALALYASADPERSPAGSALRRPRRS